MILVNCETLDEFSKRVSEIGLILFSMESGGDCLGIGITTADFKREGK